MSQENHFLSLKTRFLTQKLAVFDQLCRRERQDYWPIHLPMNELDLKASETDSKRPTLCRKAIVIDDTPVHRLHLLQPFECFGR